MPRHDDDVRDGLHVVWKIAGWVVVLGVCAGMGIAHVYLIVKVAKWFGWL